MRLHLSSAQPWCWAANWAKSPGATTPGDCKLIDADGHQDWPHRVLHALAEALILYRADCGQLPLEVTVLLTPDQAAALGDFQRRLWYGPWGSVEATALAAMIVRKGVEIRFGRSSHHERRWMKDAAAQVAVADTMLGIGGIASRVAAGGCRG